MKQLLSIEFTKLKKLSTLKIILLVYAAIVPLWMLLLGYIYDSIPISKMIVPRDNLYAFPGIWGTITYSASFFNLMVAVIVVVITCNEIHFRTMKQNVIDGLTKQQVILSKVYVIILLSVITTLYTALMGLLIGSINSGFDHFTKNTGFIPIYFLQTIGYFSFAFFFAVLVRKPALSIIFFIMSFLVEVIIGKIIDNTISFVPYQFFPLNSFSSLTPDAFFGKLKAAARAKEGIAIWEMPAWGHYLLSVFYIILFLTIAYRVLKKRDL